MQKPKREFTVWKNLGSSFVSAVTVKTLLAPLERVKIFMQTDINNRRFLVKTGGREIVSYASLVKVRRTRESLRVTPAPARAGRAALVLERQLGQPVPLLVAANAAAAAEGLPVLQVYVRVGR